MIEKFEKLLEKALAILFPPRFDPIRDWNQDFRGETFDGIYTWVNMGPVEGECGEARPKKYRDGIDRVMQEGV